MFSFQVIHNPSLYILVIIARTDINSMILWDEAECSHLLKYAVYLNLKKICQHKRMYSCFFKTFGGAALHQNNMMNKQM